MKERRLICCLCVGLCCPWLFGQQAPRQTLASAKLWGLPNSDEGELQPELPPPGGARSELASASGGLLAPAAIAGNASIYQAAIPHETDAVCSQALQSAQVAAQSDYAFSHAQLNSAALKAAFTHENIVKMARNFMPGQPLPDAPTYVPLTPREKFDHFVHNIHTVGFGLGILTDSFISQATGAYPRFNTGMAGYGQRLGAAAAGETSAAFFSGYVFPTLLHQDPRYFRSHQDAISDRLAYAASRVIIGRSDSGHNVINWSVLMSQFTQAAVSNAYIPYRNESVSGTVENALAGLGAVAQANILNEFWPDIKEFFHRHEPEALLHHKSTTNAGMQLASN